MDNRNQSASGAAAMLQPASRPAFEAGRSVGGPGQSQPVQRRGVHARVASSLITPGARVGAWPSAAAIGSLINPDLLASGPVEVVDAGHLNSWPTERPFDLLLIRGRPEQGVVDRAIDLLGPKGRLLLACPPDPALDAPKARLREHGHVGPQNDAGDVEGEHLWWGGRGVDPWHLVETATDPATLPTVVNFFTVNTPYEREVQGLIASCARLGWPCEAVGIEPRGRWELNCAYKARFVRERWLAEPRRAIVWLDADALVHRLPPLFAAWASCRAPAPDLAVHKHHGWTFASGTAYFGASDLAGELLDRWVELSEIDPSQWDQVHLANAWEDVAGAAPLHTAWLPQAYTKITHWGDEDGTSADVVVEHRHASSRFHAAVSGGAPPLAKGTYPAVQATHGASRPARRSDPPQVFEHLADLAGLLGAIAPGRALETTRAEPVLGSLAGCAMSRVPAIRTCRPDEIGRVDASAFDLIFCRDLPDLASEATEALILKLRAGARIGVLVGGELDSAAAQERVATWRPDRSRIYSTTHGRAWILLAWAKCALPVLENPAARVATTPGPAGAAGNADALAALEARMNQLHGALMARTRFDAFLRGALIRAVGARCADRGWRRIALYGAGRHTHESLEAWKRTGLEIACIFDDAPRQERLGAIPV